MTRVDMNTFPDHTSSEPQMTWANDWWDSQGSYATLHEINPVRLAFIQKRVSLSGCQALDIGCGGGILTESLARAGAQAMGIDTSTEAIRSAKNHARENGLAISYQVGDASTLIPGLRQGFDCVTCLELLEHVCDPQSIIQNAAELAKPGGSVFFSTINRTFRAWLLAIVAAEHVLKLTPRGLHRFDCFRTPEEIQAWAQPVGLERKDGRGLLYLPGLGTAFLTGDLSVNYILHFEKR